ncbi:MAG: hypothetical protein EXQ90_01995 [Rhodospirillales bacterium]|nr:hypothetical protein [Rhodospirillales bacterium]
MAVWHGVGMVRRSPAYTVSEADVAMFASLSLDFASLHTDAAYAAKGIFGRRVGHGLLGMCLMEGRLGRALGSDAVSFAWEWEFQTPFFDGDTLVAEATVEMAEARGDLEIVTEAVVVSNQRGEAIQKGRHKVARSGKAADRGWARLGLSAPHPGFAEIRVTDDDSPPPTTASLDVLAETSVFFEDVALGDRFSTPAITVDDFAVEGFAGLIGEIGAWFADEPTAQSAGLRERVVPPLYGLALVEGLKYASRGVGIPMASLSWRWLQVQPIYRGDTLHVDVTVQGKRASRSKTDRGVVAQTIELVAAGRGVVQRGQHLQMFRRRPA